MLTVYRAIIAIGYNYNYWEFVSFVDTEDAGRTKADIPYLSKYLDQFDNVAISPVDRNLFTYKLFVPVNEVDSRKNPDSLV